MYTMVLMMAMTTSGDTAAFGKRGGGCGGCNGDVVVVSAGCSGGCIGDCNGGGRKHKLFSGGGLFSRLKAKKGCNGCNGGGCNGVVVAPDCCPAPAPAPECCPAEAAPAPAPAGETPPVAMPDPKTEDDEKKE